MLAFWQLAKQGLTDELRALISTNEVNVNVQYNQDTQHDDNHRFNKLTLLSVAIANRKSDTCCMLISLGANVNLLDHDNYSPLALAVYQNLDEVCQLLISRGGDVCFHHEAFGSMLHQVKLFICMYVVVCVTLCVCVCVNSYLTVQVKSKRIAKMLFESNPASFLAQLNIQRRTEKDTPLHLTFERPNIPLSFYLISLGADLTLRNRWKKTALEGMHYCAKKDFESKLISFKKVNFFIYFFIIKHSYYVSNSYLRVFPSVCFFVFRFVSLNLVFSE